MEPMGEWYTAPMTQPAFQSLAMPGAQVLFAPGLVPVEDRSRLLSELRAQAQWKQDYLRIQGQEIALPRLTAWHGDPGTAYGYSGVANIASPWTPALEEMRCLLGAHVDVIFNSVLLNFYRDGKDSVSWHADDEPELGTEPVIASISLGASRKFSFKHRTDKALRLDLTLSDGDVLLMRGDTQRNWLHQVPKTTKPIGERMNLTFRVVRPRRAGFSPKWG